MSAENNSTSMPVTSLLTSVGEKGVPLPTFKRGVGVGGRSASTMPTINSLVGGDDVVKSLLIDDPDQLTLGTYIWMGDARRIANGGARQEYYMSIARLVALYETATGAQQFQQLCYRVRVDADGVWSLDKVINELWSRGSFGANTTVARTNRYYKAHGDLATYADVIQAMGTAQGWNPADIDAQLSRLVSEAEVPAETQTKGHTLVKQLA